jgi:hypothetical protein
MASEYSVFSGIRVSFHGRLACLPAVAIRSNAFIWVMARLADSGMGE